MTRALAAALLILLALTLATAQEEEKPVRLPFGGGRSFLPFDVVEQNGKSAWKVVGRGNVKVEDLVGGLSSALGKRISFSAGASAMARGTVPWVAPESGMVIPNEELLAFSNELFASSRLAVVGMSGTRGTLATFDEATGFAPHVMLPALATVPAGEWATVTYATKFAGPGVVQQAVQTTVTRGVMHVGMEGNQIIMTGPIDQVRKLVNVVSAIDQPRSEYDSDVVKTYTLTGTVQAAQAVTILTDLFDAGATDLYEVEGKYRVRETSRPTVKAIALGTNRVLVRASVQDHTLVASALDALK
ncbi:MAG: hypothetical protein IPK87_02340 [Planctomycetes bacterium]|nr:hypothetical protein [Planctomycetota bacterium]